MAIESRIFNVKKAIRWLACRLAQKW